MRRSILTLILIIWSASAGSAAPPGMEPINVAGPRPLTGHVLYPAIGGVEAPFSGGPVAEGIIVQTGGARVAGAKPLVILSHGIWGNRFNQLWLAERLVDEGYIVLALDHPGTSTWNRDPAEGAKLWERPRDLSRLLDAFLASPDRAASVDPSQIYAVGHSLGGYTVLAAAGARFDPDLLRAFCRTAPRAIACRVFERLGVQADDDEALRSDLSDDRISGVIAIDPGGVPALSPDSIAAAARIAVISAGRTPDILNPNFEAKRLAAMGDIEHVAMSEAGHFDFLSACTPTGVEILKAEEPEAVRICEEGETPRADLHHLAAEHVVRILSRFKRQ